MKGAWGQALVCVALAACGSGEPGCGPHYIDEVGGLIYNSERDCGTAGVTIPFGALDRQYEVDVDCYEPDLAPPEGYLLATKMFVFHPVDLAMAQPGEFEIAHGAGDGEVAVAWRPTDTEARWSVLDVPLEADVWNGEARVLFPFDRFGYFIVVTPRDEDVGDSP